MLQSKSCNLDNFNKISCVHFSFYGELCKNDIFLHVYTIDKEYLDFPNDEIKCSFAELKWFMNDPIQGNLFEDHINSNILPYQMMPSTDIYWLPHVLYYHQNPIGGKMTIDVQLRINKEYIVEYVSFNSNVYEGFMSYLDEDEDEY